MGILNIRQSLVIVMIKREMTKHQWVNGSIFTVSLFYHHRPVRMRMNLNTNMEMVGLREPYKATYKVSCNIRISQGCYHQPSNPILGFQIGLEGTYTSQQDTKYFFLSFLFLLSFCSLIFLIQLCVLHNVGSPSIVNTWSRRPNSKNEILFLLAFCCKCFKYCVMKNSVCTFIVCLREFN